MNPVRFAILASGGGSNAESLIVAGRQRGWNASVVVVISNVAGAAVLTRAERLDVPAVCVPHEGLTREAHDTKLLSCLATHRVDHLLLAGYQRLLSAHFLRTFPGAVLNVHPALLPEFPGNHAARRQWEAGVRVAGATVHFVDEGIDTGQVLLQKTRWVPPGGSLEAFSEQLKTEVEHPLYAEAVTLFLDRLRLGATRATNWRLP